MQIKVNVNNICQDISDILNENEYNIHEINFKFCEEYSNNLVKIALFTNKETTYKVIIVNDKCSIPPEILKNKGEFILGVYAYETNNEELILRYSPSPIKLFVSNGSYISDEETENSQPITPSELEQYQQALQEGLSEVNEKIPEINEAIEHVDQAVEDVDNAVEQVNNMDLDAIKVGDVATVTLTKKDGTVKTVHINDGLDLQFMWQGTSLGIKTEDQQEYTFVDLQGVQGERGETGAPFTIKKTYPSIQAMNADFNNMQLGDYVMIASTVEIEDNAKLYTRGESQWIFITDFSGATGIRGETGLTPNIQIGNVTSGNAPSVTRTGTNENPLLNFVLEKGDKGDQGIQGIQGETGNGIASIVKTGTSGLIDTYTITFTDGTTTTFEITNGEDGEVTETELNVLRQQLADQQKVINQLPQVSGSGTEITLNNTIESPMTQFDVKGNSTQETGLFKGLFRIPEALSQTKNGLTLKVNNDGSLTLTGTSTQTTTIDVYLTSPVLLNGTYTFSLKTVGTASNNSIQFLLYGGTIENKTSLGLNPAITSNSTKSVTNTVDNTVTVMRFFCSNGKTANCTIYPILEVGDTATDWDSAETKYAPNPNYEQPIYNAGDNINLFDKSSAVAGALQADGSTSNSTTLTTSDFISIDVTEIYYKTDTGSVRVKLYDENKTVISTSGYNDISNFGNAQSFTIPSGFETAKYIRITMQNQYVNTFKIEKGNRGTGYSPYGIGSITEKIVNKNLLDVSDIVSTSTIINNGNGSITLNGNVPATNFTLTNPITLKANNSYTLSLSPLLTGDTKASTFVLRHGSTNVLACRYDIGTISVTPTEDITIDTIRFYNGGITFNNYIFYPQLEQGGTATLFVEHQEQKYTIQTQQPMRGIGDVRDEFVKINDVWYERHNILRFILDGTENWSYTSNCFRLNKNDVIATDSSQALNVSSNYYINYPQNELQAGTYDYGISARASSSGTTNGLVIRNKDYEDVTDFKAYLAQKYTDGNLVYVDYVTITPLDLLCTQEQNNVLENLPSSYYGQTNIYSEDSIPAYVEAKALLDLNTLINS